MTRRSARLTSWTKAACFSSLALVGGCSGPQPLSQAIRPADEQAYAQALAANSMAPKQAYFAWRAASTGKSVAELATADAQLSTTSNPFKARSDVDAVSRGAVLYKAHCISCHGENVDGRSAAIKIELPNMDFHAFSKRFAATLHGGAPKAWFQKINDGFTSEVKNADGTSIAMPPFRDVLAREQIWLTITYLQSLDVDLPATGEGALNMQTTRPESDLVLLTGATGFVGHYVLAELLRAGQRCVVLLRGPQAKSMARMRRLLADLNVDADGAVAGGRLAVLEGDLPDRLPVAVPVRLGKFAAIVHVAASIRFDADVKTSEPDRTNIEGTRRLLAWATQLGVREFHLVSTAYVCGIARKPVTETFESTPPRFHNDYERSKWQAERLGTDWARHTGGVLTIHRPSIVVGEHGNGRATKFDGLYLSARAAEAMGRMYTAADPRRHTLPLRLRGRATDCQNIVPVDYVGAMIAAAVRRPTAHGRVYHLVHPAAPTNQLITDAFNDFFDIRGGHWVPPDRFDNQPLSTHERLFMRISDPIRHYFSDAPIFIRTNAAALERTVGTSVLRFDTAALHRLLDYGKAARWAREETRPAAKPSRESCADFFEGFLPRSVPLSQIARMAALSTIMRFDIEDEPNGQWVCRFDHGALAEVHRGPNSLHEDFGYRLKREVFFRAVAGDVHPQHAFLSGEIDIFGDVERALKMAMILHAFSQECPYHLAGVH